MSKSAFKPDVSPEPEETQDTFFHRLPGELRNQIYHFSLLKNNRIELHNFREPALAITLPDFRYEIYDIVLSGNQLEATVYTTFNCQKSDLYRASFRCRTRGDKYKPGKRAIPANS